MENIYAAIILTLLAGMATGVGSIIAFTLDLKNERILSICTGFSAGVMIYVSLVEIYNKSNVILGQLYGEQIGNILNLTGFFAGILLIAVIDNLVPSSENPHETHSYSERKILLPDGETNLESRRSKRLKRIGILTALAITIHNFPEGFVTFFATLNDLNLGIPIAIAVALHNIPEGISVSVPIYYATGNRKKAFLYSFLTGLSETIGALIAFSILLLFASDVGKISLPVTGLVFAVVAGIMVYISLDELLPTSKEYGKGHDSILSLVAGMFVMAISLLFLKQ